MTTRSKKLTQHEIQQAFADGPGAQVPVILTLDELATLARVHTKTLCEWVAKGPLDGAFRKRGKRLLFWRDRAIDILFNGKEWQDG